jgi:predicted ATPase
MSETLETASSNNPARRLIITGASGVGKTTMVEELAPLLSLPVIPEIARKLCHDMGHDRPTQIVDQKAFKEKVLDLQIEAEEEVGAFISDRSTIDCWALWQRWELCSAMTYDTEAYYKKARAQAGKYTHVIYVEPSFPPEEDGFRWTDADYQQQIDRIIRMTLFDWQLWPRTFVVQSSDKQTRIKEALHWLEKTFHIRDIRDSV